MTNRELLIKALKGELKNPECTNRILFDHLTCPEVPGVEDVRDLKGMTLHVMTVYWNGSTRRYHDKAGT